MTKKNKTYHLTIKTPQSPPSPLTLVLTLPNQRGACHKCHLEKEICVISEKPIGLSWEVKNFCWACALDNLYELEQSNYEFENKKGIIKELRVALWEIKTPPSPEKENWLECYG